MPRSRTLLRWTPRLLGGALGAVLLVIGLREALADPASLRTLSTPDVVLLAMHGFVAVGLLVGWIWPLGGGVLALAGAAAPLLRALALRAPGIPALAVVEASLAALYILDGLLPPAPTRGRWEAPPA